MAGNPRAVSATLENSHSPQGALSHRHTDCTSEGENLSGKLQYPQKGSSRPLPFPAGKAGEEGARLSPSRVLNVPLGVMRTIGLSVSSSPQ